MRSRPRDPAVPVAGAGVAVTTVLWVTVGAPIGVVSLIVTVLLSCGVRYLDFVETTRRDQHVRDLAKLALSEHIPLAASSTPTGLEIHVTPDAKEHPDA